MRLGVSAGVAGALVFAVFPTRTYLDQRRDIALAKQRIELLSRENQRLSTRVKQLHSDAEIERLAREQYNLVRPGEEAYALLPAPGEQPPPPPPRLAPPKPPKRDKGVWSRVVEFVTFWD